MTKGLKITMRDNLTGEVKVIDSDLEWVEHSRWMWTEGNFGCDCNRALFFKGVDGEDDDTLCGRDRYSVPTIDVLEHAMRVEIDGFAEAVGASSRK